MERYATDDFALFNSPSNVSTLSERELYPSPTPHHSRPITRMRCAKYANSPGPLWAVASGWLRRLACVANSLSINANYLYTFLNGHLLCLIENNGANQSPSSNEANQSPSSNEANQSPSSNRANQSPSSNENSQ
ncbi:hypothetical protein CDAR_462091 [Caerostris darwini]|uniref:Uncharacterized protein n=1 Tax=Caerostris darwini TaxID=1538125 RepID=A0AAV4TMF0_9ARAC|nr:hypothetical protein CDAR_462091 [Caerostris darwini]